MSTSHEVVAEPEQAPVHCLNTKPGEAEAVSCTVLPEAKNAEHCAPQRMPLGVLLTWPPGVAETLRRKALEAVTSSGVDDTVQTHWPVPLHPPPLQPVNCASGELGVAVSVSTVPTGNDAWQVPLLQVMPGGLLTTVTPVEACTVTVMEEAQSPPLQS